MKEFYVVSDNHVKKKKLRETPKFYIDDATGEKYKKTDNSNYLAHYRYSGGRWGSIHYYVYNLDHETPRKLIEKNLKSIFSRKVRKAAEEKIKKCESYSDCVELNHALKLGIEL